MTLIRIVLAVVWFPIWLALNLVGLFLRILGGISSLGGPGIRVTRGPVNPYPTAPAWSRPDHARNPWG